MGKDNQPKVRQAVQLARRQGRRAPCDRILIVSEGSKTEPLYLGELRADYRLPTANVQVHPGRFGTTPLQVVEYAEHLFVIGDETKDIQPRAFEQIYAVFDRDDHDTYHNALAKAAALDGKLRNDLKQPVRFTAIASVPCFELWLLLHFEDVLAPLHRTEVYQRLRSYLPDYNKGQHGHYANTKARLADAMQRAEHLALLTNAYDGVAPYTDLHRLVHLLTTLKP
jgi:hypothetical protein